MKTVSGAITSQMKSAGKVIDSQKQNFIKMTKSEKTKYGKKLVKSKQNVDSKSSTSRNKLKKINSSKIDASFDARRQKSKSISDGPKNKLPVKKKISTLSKVKKTVILTEEKSIEKSRIRTIQSILHFLKTARNLKKISLAKVGLSDASCVTFQQEFNKKEMSNKINDKNKIKSLNLKKSNNKTETNNDIKSNKIGEKDANGSINGRKNLDRTPQVFISQEIPEIITSIEDNFQPKKMEKDIDSSIYKDMKIREKELSEDSNDDFYNLDISNEKNINLVRKRNLEVIIYLNELSVQSGEDLINILQLS